MCNKNRNKNTTKLDKKLNDEHNVYKDYKINSDNGDIDDFIFEAMPEIIKHSEK